MFFCPELLRKKGHPFFVLWIAATQRGDRRNKYLTPRKVAGVNIDSVVEDVLRRVITISSIPRHIAMQDGCLSLYLCAKLMYGCCVVLKKQTAALFDDLGTVSKNMRRLKFSSTKSQLVLQVPKKSKTERSIGDLQASKSVREQPDDFVDVLALCEILCVDSDEDPPDFSANSVLEQTITMVEVDPFIPAVEDTCFGDEGDGGEALIEHMIGPVELAETVFDDQGQRDNDDEMDQIDYPELEPDQAQQIALNDLLDLQHPHRIPDVQLDQAEPTVHPEQEPSSFANEIAQSYLRDLEPSLTADPDHPELEPDQAQQIALNDLLDLQHSYRIPDVQLDQAEPTVHPEQEPSGFANEIAQSYLRDLEPSLPTDEIVPPGPQPGQVSPLLQEESDLMVLPELTEVPNVRGQRKRVSRLIIDERIKIPTAEVARRIAQEHSDTSRKTSVYEDATLMLLTAKWLNLSAMKQPGRSGNLNKSLGALFSRHVVTRTEPDDNSDSEYEQSFDQTNIMRKYPASRQKRQYSSDNREAPSLKRQRTSSAVSDPMENLQTTMEAQQDSHPQYLPDYNVPFGDLENQDQTTGVNNLDLTAGVEDNYNANLKDQTNPFGINDSGLIDRSKPTEIIDALQGEKEPPAKRQRTGSTVLDPMENLHGPETTLEDERNSQLQSIPNFYLDDVQDEIETTGVNDQGTMNETRPTEGFEEPQDEIQTTRVKDPGLIEGTRLTGGFQELQGQIQTPGVDDLGLMDGNMSPHASPQLDAALEGNPPQESTSGSSVSSSRPPLAHDVLLRAVELAGGRNESTIPIGCLCPPSGTKRVKAAAMFGALLDLHNTRHVTLRQDTKTGLQGCTMNPISVTINQLS